ncbi:YcnI family copper-binding membrane protein [Actinophytocola sp.]|uniref:YcnI family copper-binding membrane protein n=1 Tax=Actinophytocola sp. TaxID=1872138 RepID=UPI003D6ADEF1
MSTNGFKRAGAVVGVTVVTSAALLLGSGAASAHVTAKVLGETAEQGGYTKITLRVPNEEDDAGTVKLEVQVPTDTPISSMRTKAVPGWKAVVTTTKLDEPVEVHGAEVAEAVSKITWTAGPGVRINPGEFAEFEVSGGPLPEAEQLVMPAIQTYDDKKVVRWDEPPTEDGSEPEHPAPVVELTPASEGSGHHAASAPPAEGESGASHDVENVAAESSSDDTARWLGGAGLLVGALGLGVGVGATMRARKAVSGAKTGGES